MLAPPELRGVIDRSHKDVLQKTKEAVEHIIELLHGKGANLEAQESNGCTAIVNAAYEGSAALMLSEDRVLRALSSAENAAAAHLPSNPKSGDLELGALRVALTSALSEARREGALSMKSWQRLSKCFAAFSALLNW